MDFPLEGKVFAGMDGYNFLLIETFTRNSNFFGFIDRFCLSLPKLLKTNDYEKECIFIYWTDNNGYVRL